MLGGKAARDAFAALNGEDKTDLLAFLRSLRTPLEPAKGLLKKLQSGREKKRRSKSSRE